MRLIPIWEEKAVKGTWAATFFDIIAAIGLIVSIVFLNIEGIIGCIILFAVAGLLNDIRAIMWHTKGYYIVPDETDLPPEDQLRNENQ